MRGGGENCEEWRGKIVRGGGENDKKEKEEVCKVGDQIKSCTIDQCSEPTSSSLSGYGLLQVQ